MAECKKCDKFFASPFSLKRHQSTVHSVDSPKRKGEEADSDDDDQDEFWREIIRRLIRENMRHSDDFKNITSLEDLLEEPNFGEIEEELVEKIKDVEHIHDLALSNPLMKKIRNDMTKMQQKFSGVLSDDEQENLVWEKYGSVIKNRIINNKSEFEALLPGYVSPDETTDDDQSDNEQ